jgi:hypothetical protein
MAEIIKVNLFEGNIIPDGEEPENAELFALGKIGAKAARQWSWAKLKAFLMGVQSAERIVGDNYELKRTVQNSGAFSIQLKYKMGYNTSFVLNLFEVANAQVYFSELIDAISEVNGYSSGTGDWTIDRYFRDYESGGTRNYANLNLILGGDARGISQSYFSPPSWGSTYSGDTGDRLIDLMVDPVKITVNSTVGSDIDNPTRHQIRVLTLKGYYINN